MFSVTKALVQNQWSLDIVFDSSCLLRYNEIFKFLMKLKRAVWITQQHKDTCHRRPLNWRPEPDPSLPEHLVQKNRYAIDRLLFRIRIFQSEMHHLFHNLEYYFCTKLHQSLEQLCRQF